MVKFTLGAPRPSYIDVRIYSVVLYSRYVEYIGIAQQTGVRAVAAVAPSGQTHYANAKRTLSAIVMALAILSACELHGVSLTLPARIYSVVCALFFSTLPAQTGPLLWLLLLLLDADIDSRTCWLVLGERGTHSQI